MCEARVKQAGRQEELAEFSCLWKINWFNFTCLPVKSTIIITLWNINAWTISSPDLLTRNLLRFSCSVIWTFCFRKRRFTALHKTIVQMVSRVAELSSLLQSPEQARVEFSNHQSGAAQIFSRQSKHWSWPACWLVSYNVGKRRIYPSRGGFPRVCGDRLLCCQAASWEQQSHLERENEKLKAIVGELTLELKKATGRTLSSTGCLQDPAG